MSLLELNFLPTSGSALTNQQLILAREYRGHISLTDKIDEDHKIFFKVIKMISRIRIVHLCFRWCPWNRSLVEYPQEGHPILWEIHGSAKMLLLWLQVISPIFIYLVQLDFLLTWFIQPYILFCFFLPRDELPEAAYMHQLLGLNLLFLLSQNRVSEFHTELERLSARDIQTNVYIRHPVSLEQVLLFIPFVQFLLPC